MTSQNGEFKNYRQHYVISRHVGGLLGDVSCHVSGTPLGWGGSICLVGESQSRIYPNEFAKFGCGPTVVSKKRGLQTDRHTKGHCRFI